MGTGEHLRIPPRPSPRATSNESARTPRAVAVYIGILVSAAVLAGLAVALAEPSVSGRHVAIVLALATVSIVAELAHYRRAAGVSGSVGHIPILALAIVVPTWPTIVAVVLSCSIAAVVHRRPVIRSVFNASQIALATAAAVFVFRALGAAPLEALPPGALLTPRIVGALFGADIAFVLVNSSAVCGVISLSTGRRFLTIWRENTLSTLFYLLFAVPFFAGLAWAVVHWGYIAAVAIALPLLGFRQLYFTKFELLRTTQELLEMMVSAIEARDTYTSGHSRRVAAMAVVIARAVGLPDRTVKRIHVAGLLHDVGKIHEKYAAVLQKPDRLTREEWHLMQQHPADGEELVRKVSQLHDVLPGVRHHHEKWDGTGYPDGLAGESIPFQARILAVADTIDAMTSDRPYRPGLSKDQVYSELRKWSGKQFDPVIVGMLLDTPHWDALFEAAKAVDGRAELALVKTASP